MGLLEERANDRIRLPRETRMRLIHRYVARVLQRTGSRPSQRDVSDAVGGDIRTILEVLRTWKGRVARYRVVKPMSWLGRSYQPGEFIAVVEPDHIRRLDSVAWQARRVERIS